MKKILVHLLFLAILLLPPFAHATTPNQALSDANSIAVAANEFMAQAEKLLKGAPERAKIELALSFYAKAGEMFERAHRIYVALGPSYASRQDVEGSYAAVQQCVNNMNELKKRL